MNMKRAITPTAIILFVVCLVLALATSAEAKTQNLSSGVRGSEESGFVKLDTGREVYFQYTKPIAGRPVVVLLNGLTNKVSHWSAFTHQFRGSGVGILRFDFAGQGKTLLKSGFVTKVITWREQVEDVRAILDAMNLRNPVHLVGLSYGGGIATMFSTIYPKRVASVIAMAPYVMPVDSQDRWIQLQIQQTRLLFPFNPSSNEELYDYFLRQLIYATFPVAEPMLLENPYALEATFQLTQGIRKLLVLDHVEKIPESKYHLVIARMDQLIPNETHNTLWKQMPRSSRASRLYIEFAGHKIQEYAPVMSGQWARRIVLGDKEISGGKTFVGDPFSGKIEHIETSEAEVFGEALGKKGSL